MTKQSPPPIEGGLCFLARSRQGLALAPKNLDHRGRGSPWQRPARGYVVLQKPSSPIQSGRRLEIFLRKYVRWVLLLGTPWGLRRQTVIGIVITTCGVEFRGCFPEIGPARPPPGASSRACSARLPSSSGRGYRSAFVQDCLGPGRKAHASVADRRRPCGVWTPVAGLSPGAAATRLGVSVASIKRWRSVQA
jgi:hypothetical protein